MFTSPDGMNRRHFMAHVASAAALTAPVASQFVNTLRANAAPMMRNHKAAILLFMNAGPATIDMFDLKPGAATGGPFKPINTTGAGQITEHLPLLAQQMHHLNIVRSMSTREADHNRARYYMHTGYVPNPNIVHPSYGAVVAHEMAAQTQGLEIPPFVSIGGSSYGPGFLGMSYAPFVVTTDGRVENLEMGLERDRLNQRLAMLSQLENNFARQGRGEAPIEHAKVVNSAVTLMTSNQMEAFKVDSEPDAVKERYGIIGGNPAGAMGMNRGASFGRGCLMARRLVEQGVPFVEVDLGGWDDHQNVHTSLQTRLPILDQGFSALVEDLAQRGMLEDTAVIWMGDFGRTPRINGRAGRDHWARSWSTIVGGAGMKAGQVIGATNEDGTQVTTDPYTSQDLMASVLKALGVSLDTTFTSKNNRPMKIANSGRIINELF